MTRNKKLVKLMALAVAASTVATSVPAYAAFDATYYAQQNPDVVAAIGTKPADLETHYNVFGKKEGRAGSADEAGSALRQLFDAEFYAKMNPDVVAVLGNDANALFNHFLQFGIKEGRRINPYFDVNAYKKAYPDLVAAFGDDIAAYYNHFANHGISEHRTLGGFPAEKIVPGGVVAYSGGDSSSSSGGGGSSSSKPAPKPADVTPTPDPTPAPAPDKEKDPEPQPTPQPEVDEKVPTLEDVTIGKAEAGRIISALNLPSGVTIDDTTWKSSNEAVVTVASGGVLTPIKEGTSTISVKLNNEAATELSCTVTVVSAYIELLDTELNVAVGTTELVSVAHSYPSNSPIAFFSSDESIAKVDSDGVVTGVKAGTATITARYTYSNTDYTDTCVVTVSEPYVKLKKTALTVRDIDDPINLATELAPETVPSNKTIVYEIDDTDVATITGSTLTIVGAGNATITVKFAIGSKVYKSECALTVTETSKGVSFGKEVYDFYTNESPIIKRNAVGTEQAGYTPQLMSTDEGVATVAFAAGPDYSTIEVTPVGVGTTTITTTAKIGGKVYTTSCTINIKAPSVISITGPTEVQVGDDIQLAAATDPVNGTITWGTTTGTLVSVDSTGKVTGLAAGDAVITAKIASEDPKTYSVRVVDNVGVNTPASVVIAGSNTLTESTSGSLTSSYTATVKNANGDPITGASVTWSVASDPNSTGATIGASTGVLTVPENKDGTIGIKATVTGTSIEQVFEIVVNSAD